MAGLIFSSYELVMFVMGPIYGRYVSVGDGSREGGASRGVARQFCLGAGA